MVGTSQTCWEGIMPPVHHPLHLPKAHKLCVEWYVEMRNSKQALQGLRAVGVRVGCGLGWEHVVSSFVLR